MKQGCLMPWQLLPELMRDRSGLYLKQRNYNYINPSDGFSPTDKTGNKLGGDLGVIVS